MQVVDSILVLRSTEVQQTQEENIALLGEKKLHFQSNTQVLHTQEVYQTHIDFQCADLQAPGDFVPRSSTQNESMPCGLGPLTLDEPHS